MAQMKAAFTTAAFWYRCKKAVSCDGTAQFGPYTVRRTDDNVVVTKTVDGVVYSIEL
jgi:hypothetical protein